jgi:hypothetical protein
MASRHFLMILEESSYGTPALTTGAPSTSRFSYVRLDQNSGNAYTLRGQPNWLELPRVDGYAGRGKRLALGGGTFGGDLTMLVTYTQAKRLLDLATIPVNSGRTTPWVTTDASSLMPAGDLASVSIYEGIDADGTVLRTATRGAKIARLRLACSAQSPAMIATITFAAQKVDPDNNYGGSDSTAPSATEFPEPSESDFPTDLVLFQHCGGAVTIGSARTLFDTFAMEIVNSFDPFRGPNNFVQRMRFWGRESATLGFRNLLTAATDRTAYEANTALDARVTFTLGNQSIAIDFNEANRIDTPPQDSLENGKTFFQELSIANYYDATAAADLSITCDNTP